MNFHPIIECNSILQARQLIQKGMCAGILRSVGIYGLDPSRNVIREFASLNNYCRHLVRHWNERQMRRRGVLDAVIEQIAQALRK